MDKKLLRVRDISASNSHLHKYHHVIKFQVRELLPFHGQFAEHWFEQT